MHQRHPARRLLTNRTGYRRKADMKLQAIYGPEWDRAPAQVRLAPEDLDLPRNLCAAGMTDSEERRAIEYVKAIVVNHPFTGRLAKPVATAFAHYHLGRLNDLYNYFRKSGDRPQDAFYKAMRRL